MRRAAQIEPRTNGLFGASLFVLSAAPSLPMAFPAALFVGFSSVVFMTASTAIVQLRALPEMRGRVLALQAIVFLGSTPVGGPILGVVCQLLGARVGFILGGAACFAAALWGRLVVHRRAGSRQQTMSVNPIV